MVAIVYGSSTLNTQFTAERIRAAFGADTAVLYNVQDVSVELLRQYSRLVFVTSTWGSGDLQDDWEVFYPQLDAIDFTGKTVGLVGLGDQENYPNQFCDGIRWLYDKVIERGGRIVGETGTKGYTFKLSRSTIKGRFVGLVIDEDNQADRTDQRVRDWVRAFNRSLA